MLKVSSYEEAIKIPLREFINLPIRTVYVPLIESLGKIISEDIYSKEDLPPFNRSTMDGYAVNALDTFGASSSMPAILNLAGSVKIGEYPDFKVAKGQACSMPTGGILPGGTDSVVMIEYTESLDEETVLVEKAVSPGENVILKGEDISTGELVFRKSHILRPQDIGVLASLGIGDIKVLDTLKIAVISTGNELVNPFSVVSLGKIRDINTYSLNAAILKDGMKPTNYGIVEDSFNSLKYSLESALEEADIILISGGSSVGVMDLTYKVIESFEQSEILVHGVAVKPGKPTIIASLKGKPVFGLPGHPVSAFIIYHIIVRRFIKELIGIKEDSRVQEAYFKENYASAPGRDEFVMVNLIEDTGLITACPVMGKSGMMATMSQADGFIHIPASREGIYKDERVMVQMF